MDQLDWKLLSEKIVIEQCEQMRKLICEKLQIDCRLEDENSLVRRYIMTFAKYVAEKWRNNV